MKAGRKSRYCCTLITVLLLYAGAAQAADQYPSKPGRMILPFGAGGSTDVVGRLFAQQFSEAWGQPLVIDNRAGAAGIVGTETAARAAPDGSALYNKLQYHHLRYFTLISLYATMPNILCITPKLPAANVNELVKLMKASP